MVLSPLVFSGIVKINGGTRGRSISCISSIATAGASSAGAGAPSSPISSATAGSPSWAADGADAGGEPAAKSAGADAAGGADASVWDCRFCDTKSWFMLTINCTFVYFVCTSVRLIPCPTQEGGQRRNCCFYFAAKDNAWNALVNRFLQRRAEPQYYLQVGDAVFVAQFHVEPTGSPFN